MFLINYGLPKTAACNSAHCNSSHLKAPWSFTQTLLVFQNLWLIFPLWLPTEIFSFS